MIVDYRGFDFRDPDYAGVFNARLAALDRLRAHPEAVPALKAYYKTHISDFISDWGVTFDPRNAERGLPTIIPFILFERQREWVDWVVQHWLSGTPGLCEKSRDMGVSWLALAASCSLCLFHEGMAISFGSRKEEYVDKVGTFKPLLPKGRMFMEHLPEEFRGGWVAWRDAPFMRINFPDTGSIITGEAGDQIGRGDRASIYLVDESAYLERPELVEHSLSQTTNCRIDMSSVNGMNNPFAKKRHEGKVDVFIFDWHEDPRKDDAWYEKQVAELDPVTVAQEIDRDYSASVSGIVIPGAWVRSAVGALEKLGIAPTGRRALALDVADEGIDKNAACGVTGTEIDFLDEWSGKGGDIFETVQRTFGICDEQGYDEFRYDADGLGAGVRGDARVVNEARKKNNAPMITAVGYRGSAAPADPDGIVEGTMGREGDKGRTNKDYFANSKAQGWFLLRRRFQKTHRWVVEGVRCAPDDIISISKSIPSNLRNKLVAELSQVTYAVNNVGKIVINKKPDGMKSPNLADGAMIRFAQMEAQGLPITPALLHQVARMAPRRRRY